MGTRRVRPAAARDEIVLHDSSGGWTALAFLRTLRIDGLHSRRFGMKALLADLRKRNVFRVADRLRARAFADPAYQDPTRMMILAWHAALFGDDALADAALRRAFVEMNGTFVPAIWFPRLARYRATPEFKQLVSDLNLVECWRTTGNWGDYCRPKGADDFECR